MYDEMVYVPHIYPGVVESGVLLWVSWFVASFCIDIPAAASTHCIAPDIMA